jgi:hypothetical protein
MEYSDRLFTCNSCKETFPIKKLEEHVKEYHFWD